MGHGWRCRWTSLWTSCRWSYAPAAACTGCCTAPGPRPVRITLTRPTLCALSALQSAAAPLLEAWKELAADEAFSRHFAGLVEGGSAGRIGVRVWGPGPLDPDLAAPAAPILGAPVPERDTSVHIRGYPAAVALSTDDYAQLRRAAAEVFGDRVPIRVRRCTQLASSTLELLVFDLLLEGVPMDWAGIFLPSVDSRVPERVWERIVRRNQGGAVCPCGTPRPHGARPGGGPAPSGRPPAGHFVGTAASAARNGRR